MGGSFLRIVMYFTIVGFIFLHFTFELDKRDKVLKEQAIMLQMEQKALFCLLANNSKSEEFGNLQLGAYVLAVKKDFRTALVFHEGDDEFIILVQKIPPEFLEQWNVGQSKRLTKDILDEWVFCSPAT